MQHRPALGRRHGRLLTKAAIAVSCPEASRLKVDLAAVLSDLVCRGVNELHLEAGHKLECLFLQAGLVDELAGVLGPPC